MRVLIPVDGSVSCRNALDLLAARARRMQVKPEVSLINVQHPVPMGVMTQFGLDAVRAAAEEEAKGIFSDLEGSIAVRELNPEEKIGFGIPGEVISKEAEDEDCDLIIMGARGISPAKSFFLGSVSRNVLANTMKPVLLARGESLPDRENLRLVLAVDGSNYGAAAAKSRTGSVASSQRRVFSASQRSRVSRRMGSYSVTPARVRSEKSRMTLTTFTSGAGPKKPGFSEMNFAAAAP